MQYSKEKWIASYKKAVADLKAKPTAGMPCAIATLRFVRDGICEDIGEKDEDAKAQCVTIRESINELIQTLQKANGDLAGFASNASAAGKAAGFKAVDAFAGFVNE